MFRIKAFLQIFRFIINHPLAGKHKIKALYKFFSWQLLQAIRAREVVMPFIQDVRIIAVKGMAGATGNIYTGLHEFNEMAFVLHFLRKEDVFFDIGANVGSYTLLASGVVGAKTLSFEPIPSTFAYLRKNVSINHLKNVVLFNQALGSLAGRLNFTNNLDTVNHVATADDRNDNLHEVTVTTIDEVVKNSQPPVLMKIDVEGYEYHVLSGAACTLADGRLKAVIVELNGSGERFGIADNKIDQILKHHGFNTYEYDGFSRTLVKKSISNNDNVIYVRDEAFAEKRLLTARKFSIFSEKI